MKNDNVNGETMYAIHEVYYDESGGFKGYTKDPVSPYAKSPEELKEIFSLMIEGIDKDVLVYSEED